MPTRTPADIHAAARRFSAANHAGTIRAYFPYWDSQFRPFLLKAVEALPAEHFGFKPRPEMMTAHQVIVHLSEAEYGWIHHDVDGEPYQEWIVPHEDPSRGWVTDYAAPDHAALLAMLEK